MTSAYKKHLKKDTVKGVFLFILKNIHTMKKTAYLVTITVGGSHDFSHRNIFVTHSRTEAKKYATRYNNLIENHVETARMFDEDEMDSFMQWDILNEAPLCSVSEIEYRDFSA